MRATAFLISLALPLASAADIQPRSQNRELDELRQLIADQQLRQKSQQRLLEEQTRRLQAQQRELENLKRTLSAIATTPLSSSRPHSGSAAQAGGQTLDPILRSEQVISEPMILRETRAGQQPGGQSAPSSAQQQQQAQQTEKDKPKSSKQPEQVGQRPDSEESRSQPLSVADVVREQSILTPKGTLSVTPAFSYSNDSNVRTAITGFSILPAFLIGLFDIRQINRDTMVFNVAGRYGLTKKNGC